MKIPLDCSYSLLSPWASLAGPELQDGCDASAVYALDRLRGAHGA